MQGLVTILGIAAVRIMDHHDTVASLFVDFPRLCQHHVFLLRTPAAQCSRNVVLSVAAAFDGSRLLSAPRLDAVQAVSNAILTSAFLAALRTPWCLMRSRTLFTASLQNAECRAECRCRLLHDML